MLVTSTKVLLASTHRLLEDGEARDVHGSQGVGCEPHAFAWHIRARAIRDVAPKLQTPPEHILGVAWVNGNRIIVSSISIISIISVIIMINSCIIIIIVIISCVIVSMDWTGEAPLRGPTLIPHEPSRLLRIAFPSIMDV